jgi:hypothetical protein
MYRNIQFLIVLAPIAPSSLASAPEYHGQVTFGGFPVPGATVTATQGTNKVATVTDQEGIYSFAGPSGWNLEGRDQNAVFLDDSSRGGNHFKYACGKVGVDVAPA